MRVFAAKNPQTVGNDRENFLSSDSFSRPLSRAANVITLQPLDPQALQPLERLPFCCSVSGALDAFPDPEHPGLEQGELGVQPRFRQTDRAVIDAALSRNGAVANVLPWFSEQFHDSAVSFGPDRGQSFSRVAAWTFRGDPAIHVWVV